MRVNRMFLAAGFVLAGWTGVTLAQDRPMNQPQNQPMNQNQPSNQNQPMNQNQPSSGQAAPGEMVGQLIHESATVQKVDTQKRELTLKDDAGNTNIVQVPEDVTRLDKVKKGDRVDLDYYQSVALSIKKTGETPSPSETKMIERAPGQLPGGLVARKITASAKVVKVDPTDNKVTIKGPGGAVDTINVSDPQLQSDLRKLKSGDRIEVTYSEALAASVTPKGK
jgi:Cu/Ag efflux protein CusF